MRVLLPFLVAIAASFGAAQAQAQGAPGGTPPSGSPPSGTPPSGGTSTAATLIGDSVTVTQYYPDLVTAGLSSTVTVSSAVEIACPDTSIALCNSESGLLDGETIDIGTTSVSGQFLGSFSADSGATFNGFVFTGLSFGTSYSGISGITLTTNITGLTLDRITYTSDSLSINLLGLDPSVTSDGSSIGTYTIDFTVASVPEPGPLPLMLAGLAMLGFLGRRHAGSTRS